MTARPTIPIIGELRDDPTERKLTPEEQAVERQRQAKARANQPQAQAKPGPARGG